MFTVLVGFVLFIILLIPGGLGKSSQISKGQFQDRAEKLLLEHPLIGSYPWVLCP